MNVKILQNLKDILKNKYVQDGLNIMVDMMNKNEEIQSNADNQSISKEQNQNYKNMLDNNNSVNKEKGKSNIKNQKDLDLTPRIISTAVVDANNPLMILPELINMVNDVCKYTEGQKTQRKLIEANRDTIIKGINNQKEIILEYMKRTFDERKENFEKMFLIVDRAIDSNNMEMLSMGLNSINDLVKSSPFKDLKDLETTQKKLSDPNHSWDY